MIVVNVFWVLIMCQVLIRWFQWILIHLNNLVNEILFLYIFAYDIECIFAYDVAFIHPTNNIYHVWEGLKCWGCTKINDRVTLKFISVCYGPKRNPIHILFNFFTSFFYLLFHSVSFNKIFHVYKEKISDTWFPMTSLQKWNVIGIPCVPLMSLFFLPCQR